MCAHGAGGAGDGLVVAVEDEGRDAGDAEGLGFVGALVHVEVEAVGVGAEPVEDLGVLERSGLHLVAGRAPVGGGHDKCKASGVGSLPHAAFDGRGAVEDGVERGGWLKRLPGESRDEDEKGGDRDDVGGAEARLPRRVGHSERVGAENVAGSGRLRACGMARQIVEIDAQFTAGEADGVSGVDGHGAVWEEGAGVDPGAVLAAEVGKEPHAAAADEPGMPARDGGVEEADGAVGGSADDDEGGGLDADGQGLVGWHEEQVRGVAFENGVHGGPSIGFRTAQHEGRGWGMTVEGASPRCGEQVQ